MDGSLLHEPAGIAAGSAPDREPIHLDRRNTDSYRNGLAIFAAGANPFVEFQVVTYHGYASQDVRPIADQGRPLDRGGHFAVLDEICLRRRKNKLAVRDIYLPATEIDRINSM